MTARDPLREAIVIVPTIFRVLHLLPSVSGVAVRVAMAAPGLISLAVYTIEERPVRWAGLDWAWYVGCRITLVVRPAVIEVGDLVIWRLGTLVMAFNGACLTDSISIAIMNIYIEDLAVLAIQGLVKQQVPAPVTHIVPMAVLRVRYELPSVTVGAVLHAVVCCAGGLAETT